MNKVQCKCKATVQIATVIATSVYRTYNTTKAIWHFSWYKLLQMIL